MKSMFKKKDVASILEASKSGSGEKHLGALDVTLMSIGATIGTGVMVLTGIVAARDAGPAVVLSFICSALVCMLVALCYAEFASSIPTSGSSYAYIYVTLGEVWAHLIGWLLLLGYIVSIATVAGGWSAYFVGLLREFGIILPQQFTTIPSQGGIINIPGIAIIFFITYLLSRGTKESKKANNFMVAVKLGVILLFIGVGAFHIKPANWNPFMPFGVKGVFAGAASVFFAFSGFDAVSTSAEEVKDPQKNLPRGLLAALAICTVIYVIVCLVLTGLTKYSNLNVADSMAYALNSVGQGWAGSIISAGAVIGIMAVILAYGYGTSRILFSMSRDGLLPKAFSKVNEKTNVPIFSTWVVGIVAAAMSGVMDLKQLADFANIALIGSYLLVSYCIIVFRKTHPNVKRGFSVPLVPVLPALGVLACLFLMSNLSLTTWIYFGVWLALGTVVYFTYSIKNSKLQNDDDLDKSA